MVQNNYIITGFLCQIDRQIHPVNLTKSFTLYPQKKLASATLTVTALGLYEPYLNGKKITKDYFAPGWTNYTQTLHYQTYDITRQIKKQNTISIFLNPGWYSGPFGADKSPGHYGAQPAFACSLTLSYTDGSTQTINSGRDWTATTSYIKQSDFYDGEYQDTRPQSQQQLTVLEIPAPYIKLTPSTSPPVRTHETFPIKKHWKDTQNNLILDFGQNLAGFVRLSIQGRAGDTLFIQHAETLDEKGNFYTGNLRLAKATDTYILNGKQQLLEPHFTYHGFRYARIRISPAQEPSPNQNHSKNENNKPGGHQTTQYVATVPKVFYHTRNPNPVEQSGPDTLSKSYFAKVNSSLDALKSKRSEHTLANKKTSQYHIINATTNLHSNPTKTLYAPNTLKGTQTQYTLANKNLYKKTSFKKTSAPKPNPSTILLNSQTTLNLTQTQSVALYTDLKPTGTFTCSNPLINRLQSNILWSMKSNFIDLPTDCPQRSERYGWTGDAQVFFNTAAYNRDINTFYQKYLNNIQIDQGTNGGMPNIIPDFRKPEKGPKGGTAGWGDAAVLIPWRHYQFYGQKEVLQNQYPSMKAWVDYITGRTQNGLWLDNGYGDWYAQGDSTSLPFINQAYYAHSCSLLAKAAADALAASIRANGGRLATGFLGTPFLLPVLGRYGYGKLAYDLLLSKKMPSWLYPITKGATTIWEKWDAVREDGRPKECSFNHFAYGAVGEWFYTGLAGIRATSPGFKTVEISPVIDARMKWVEAKFRSPQGVIGVKWKIVDKKVMMDLRVPSKVSAELKLPSGSINHYRKLKLTSGHSHYEFKR